MDAKKMHTKAQRAMKNVAIADEAWQRHIKQAGFGMVAPKGEGGKIVYDTGAPRRRRKGEKRPVEVDYMELPIPKNASRARVHKIVDEWLDDRARGFKGASLGLPPIKRRRKP